MKALLLGPSMLALAVIATACGGSPKPTVRSISGTPRPEGSGPLTAVRSTKPHTPSLGGIEPVHDTPSFCIELHSGRREFQIRLRNTRHVATHVTVSVENGPHVGFTLAPTSHVRILRGAWNGKHHASGCRTTITWAHTRLVVSLPLAQE
jgi:hypothetical protein